MLTLMIFLLIFMNIGAIIAIESKHLLSSVISIGAVGFGVSIMFLLLGAPDLAITQVVVEILCLIILIRGTIRLDNTAIEKHRDTFAMVTSLIFFGLFLTFAYVAYRALPEFGHPLMRVSREYLQHGVEKTGATNIVMSIVLDYRAYDTLGEATVLFTSIVGAFVVLRRQGRKKVSQPDTTKVGIPGEF
jgi:multisubunit Na+/H+ antiporter MnhB subunit